MTYSEIVKLLPKSKKTEPGDSSHDLAEKAGFNDCLLQIHRSLVHHD